MDAIVVLVETLAVLGAAVLVICILVAGGSGSGEHERLEHRTRQAERQIDEIGRSAQEAILSELLRRAQTRQRSTEWHGEIVEGEIE